MRSTSLALVAAFTLASLSNGRAATESRTTAPRSVTPDSQNRTLGLIQQLGDDQFAVRRRAEEQLIRLGPEAFDDLRQAEESTDLEVAERARYILLRMRVEWIRPEDSPEVRRALTRYGDLSKDEKEKRIAQLSALKDGDGRPALCRIARLDASPIIAREAALAVLEGELIDVGQPLADACREELGVSERPPVEWIKLWLQESADRRATLAKWDDAIQREADLLAAESSETNAGIVYPLMKRHLQTCHDVGTADDATTALLRIVDLWTDDDAPERRTNNLAWALNWIIQHKRWDVLQQVVAQRGDQLRSDRTLLYYLAAATARSGEEEQATQLANHAFAMGAGDAEQRVDIANSIVALGFFDWAEREYRRALEDLPVVSWDSLRARREWAMWLHDRQEYARAAEVLDEFFKAYKDDRAARQRLRQQLDGREFLNAIAARAEFYRACQLAEEKNFDEQRNVLEKAFRLSDDDPDILIAMYRSEGADDAYREKTRNRIQEMSLKHLALIEQYPDEPSFHNQWAWLISNTEGDYAKAVEHSLKSLELSPEEPSYLDTLGRCYYAAGDLENAVKAQRRAVELSPYFGVMRRQLEFFERNLAAKNKRS